MLPWGVLRARLTEKLRQLDPALSLHDLRIVPGRTHTNVLFDLVLPAGYAGDKVELLEQLEQFIKEQDTPTAASSRWSRAIRLPTNKLSGESIMLNETYRAMLGNKSVIRETFMYGKQRAAEIGYENVFDYSLGNPSVPCPQEFTAAMQDLLTNEEPVNLHGYCPSQGDPGFRTDVAAHLTKTFGLPYEQKHIFPTTGARVPLPMPSVRSRSPREVLTFAPYFPEYGPYVAGTGAVLKVVPPQAPTFQPIWTHSSR